MTKPDITIWCEDNRHHDRHRCVAVFSWYTWRDIAGTAKIMSDERWRLDDSAQWGREGISHEGGLPESYTTPTTKRDRRLSTAEEWGWHLRCAAPCPQQLRVGREAGRRTLDGFTALGRDRVSFADFREAYERCC